MTPSADNLYLGAGDVYFDRFDDDGNSTGFRHIGAVDALSVTHSVEKLTKKNPMDGARGTYKEVITGSEAELSMTLTEFDNENLALAMLGVVSNFTQSAATLTDNATVVNGGDAIELGKWYDLGRLGMTAVSFEQGGPALTVDVDYTFVAETGMVKFLTTGAATAVATTISATVPAITAGQRKQIHGLAAGSIQGALRFVGASNQAAGPRQMLDVWKVNLSPDGELPFLSEEFATFNVKGVVQTDTSKPEGEQFYRVLPL
jgi:hypothetical protein